MTVHLTPVSLLSCAPLIGPFAGWMNIEGQFKTIDLDLSYFQDVINRTNNSLCWEPVHKAIPDEAKPRESALKNTDETIMSQDEFSSKKTDLLSSIEQLKVDTLCTMFGSVVSVALLVSLVAAGTLTVIAPLILAGIFTVFAIRAGYILYQSQTLDKDANSLVLLLRDEQKGLCIPEASPQENC